MNALLTLKKNGLMCANDRKTFIREVISVLIFQAIDSEFVFQWMPHECDSG